MQEDVEAREDRIENFEIGNLKISYFGDNMKRFFKMLKSENRWKRLSFSFLLFFMLSAAQGASQSRLFFSDSNISRLQTEAGKRKAREMAERPKRNVMEALCLAYRVTGDEDYAAAAKERLMRLTEKPVNEISPEWGGGLSGGHRCYEMGLAYDSLYDCMTPEERQEISKRIVENGIRPMLDVWLLGETRVTTIDSMGHNWWSACVFLPGIAALAVSREQECVEPWLKRIAEASGEWALYPGSILNNKPSSFDRKGGFYESVNYANYALSTYLMFRFAWKSARPETPLPEIPFLSGSGDFFLNTCYPTSQGILSLNFGDSSLFADGSQPLLWLRALGIRLPRHLWYLARTANSNFREAIPKDSPLGLAFYPSEKELDAAPEEPDLPTLSVYPDMGWAIMRNSWKPDATMLGIKSGFTWNHAHADAGSFILFHKGENLLIDSGSTFYAKPEYDAYYRRSMAHNVVLFNGEGENPEDAYHGSKFPGSILHAVDSEWMKFVLADSTGPMSRNFIRNYRSFLWIGDVILIIDDLKTYEPGRFEWLLHPDGEVSRKGLDLVVRKGDAAIAVRPLFPERLPVGFAHDAPERLRIEERSGFKDHAEKTPVPYFAFIPPDRARVMKFVVAILLDPDGRTKAERLEGVNAIGARIVADDGTTDVWLNLRADGRMRHRNSNNLIDGWDTDAYLLAIEKDSSSEPRRIFLANGSYLRRGGQVLFDSLVKRFAVWENGEWSIQNENERHAKPSTQFMINKETNSCR